MSVLHETYHGVVLDDGDFVARCLHKTSVPPSLARAELPACVRAEEPFRGENDSHVSSTAIPLRHKLSLFDITVPFMMDSEFSANIRRLTCSDNNIHRESGILDGSKVTRRKRKRKQLSVPDQESSALRDKVCELIRATRSSWDTPPVVPDNNVAARNASALFASIPLPSGDGVLRSNLTDRAVVEVIQGESYVLPARSTWISSSFSGIHALLADNMKYDLIVIDPPWGNKSVKRLRKYDYLDETELLKTPISNFTNPGALVALWITNSESLQTFAETQLFDKWNVRKVAAWTWVKVTRSGQPVYTFESVHKKPYEKLLLGRFGSSQDTLPVDRVFVSVPSAIHSHKPYLGEILKKYLPENPKCLELFARNLTEGWTSWGLEVLKFQHISLYERSPSEVGELPRPERFCISST